MSTLADFHFLRPWWLLAILPMVVSWYFVRRHRDPSRVWRSIVAPHLLPHLLQSDVKQKWLGAIDLAMSAGCIGALAVSGPTWYRAPTPFADDSATLAIVIKVTPSMLTEDVQPSRLARSVEKIHDLLQLRGKAKACLIAYSGTAHVVMPPTTDGTIISTFAQSLDPKIMPVDGDAPAEALALAERTIETTGGGSIWWIADDIPEAELQNISRWLASSKARVSLMPVVAAGTESNTISKQANRLGVRTVPISGDDTDINQLVRMSNIETALGDKDDGRWADSGYWLTPLFVLCLLPLFRRGTELGTQ